MVPRSGERDREASAFTVRRSTARGPDGRRRHPVHDRPHGRSSTALACCRLHQLERAVEQAELLQDPGPQGNRGRARPHRTSARRAQPASLSRRRAARRIADAERPRTPFPSAVRRRRTPASDAPTPDRARIRRMAQGRLRVARPAARRRDRRRRSPHHPHRRPPRPPTSTARSARPAGASSASWKTTSSTRRRSSSPPSADLHLDVEGRLMVRDRPSVVPRRSRGRLKRSRCVSSNTVQAMRSPRDFFKPLAVGAPDPVTRDPVPAVADDPLLRRLQREDGGQAARHDREGRHRARQPRGRGAGRPQGGRARGSGQGRQDDRPRRHAAVDARQLARVARGSSTT